ncbi:hypothetical protein CALVIDRAFT_319659 [Calocera viscosa TUFC12733]|uniref:Uncharacterized protein n=1 Tax=Calocera viscosa (strain TUFC12733) TaxID=1330018 RepID=A0A167QKH5_CALVF|nr:hypothetical protein CALVIDRAFT_319659 [Calocera viscosa TUFC12733]
MIRQRWITLGSTPLHDRALLFTGLFNLGSQSVAMSGLQNRAQVPFRITFLVLVRTPGVFSTWGSISECCAGVALLLSALLTERPSCRQDLTHTVSVHELISVQVLTASHISNIPDELLSGIFEAAMQEAQDAVFSFPWPYTPLTEKLYSHITMTLYSINAVCKHWRRVALESPRIWTTIVAPLDPLWAPGYRMTLLFERSGACPLSVCATSVQPIQDLCDPLRTYNVLDRVTRLSLRGIDDDRYLALRQLRFTRLEEFQICFDLTRLVTSTMTHFPLWLQNHSSLRILKLNESCSGWIMLHDLAAIALPNLELLSLTEQTDYVMERFSKMVSAPKLLELRLRPASHPPRYDSPCFPPDTMLHIRRLVLAGDVPPKYLQNLSSLLPNIQVLQLSNPGKYHPYFGIHTSLIQLLTEDSTFPLLHTLSLHKMRIHHDRLQQFVESRAASFPTVFRALQLSQCTFFMEEDKVVDLDLQLHGIKLEGWTPAME